jgi:hypothetical protein
VNIGPVYWGAYPGEMLERVMAVLVSQEHPSAIRLTPSSGDGGVDVLIDEDTGFHVRQIIRSGKLIPVPASCGREVCQ